MASEKFATDLPADVDLISASCPAFPKRITLFTPRLDIVSPSISITWLGEPLAKDLKGSHERRKWQRTTGPGNDSCVSANPQSHSDANLRVPMDCTCLRPAIRTTSPN